MGVCMENNDNNSKNKNKKNYNDTITEINEIQKELSGLKQNQQDLSIKASQLDSVIKTMQRSYAEQAQQFENNSPRYKIKGSYSPVDPSLKPMELQAETILRNPVATNQIRQAIQSSFKMVNERIAELENRLESLKDSVNQQELYRFINRPKSYTQ